MGTIIKRPCMVLLGMLVVPIIFTCVGITKLELQDSDGWSVRNSYSARAYDAYVVASEDVEEANTNTTGASERSVESDQTLDFYWVSQREAYNLLDYPEDLYYIRNYENTILAKPKMQSICLLNSTTGECQPVHSATAYLPESIDDYDKGVFAQALLDNPDTSSFFISKEFDIDANSTEGLQLPMLRSRIFFGLPLAGYSSAQSDTTEQNDKIVSVMEDVVVDDIMDTREENKNITLYVYFTDITEFFAEQTLMTDAAFAGLAILFVLLMLCLHTRSLFLGITSMLQVILAFPTAYFIYYYVFQIHHFGTLQVLAIFVLFGIGADNVFIFWDAFQQSAVIFADQILSAEPDVDSQNEILQIRLTWSFNNAAGAMLVTSLTTFMAFFITAVTQIINIRCFGVFAALLMLVNFVLVICLLPPLVVLYVKYIQPLTCASRLFPCCQNKVSKDDLSPGELGRVSRFFRDKYIPALMKLRWVLIVLGFVLMGVFAGLSSRFKPGTRSIGDIFDSSHPVTIVTSLMYSEFTLSSSAYYTTMVTFGFGLIDRSGTSAFDPSDYGTITYDAGFAPLQSDAQEALYEMCTEFSSSNSSVRPSYVRESSSTEPSVTCWVSAFENWLDDNGELFPVSNTSYTRELLNMWYLDDANAEDYIGEFYGTSSPSIVPDPIKYMVMEVTLSVLTTANLDAKLGAFEDLASDLSSRFANGPESVGTPLVVSADYSGLVMQQSLVKTAIIGLASGVAFGFACLLIMTRNILVSVLATVNILLLSALVLGTMQLSIGSIGFMEAICITALVGLAFDFTLHYAIAYVEYKPEQAKLIAEVTPENCMPGDFYMLEDGTPVASRRLRTRVAFTRISVSVLSGAIATTVAAIALTLCEILYLAEFGKFLLEVVLFSLATSNTFFPALLACFGPQRPPRDHGQNKIVVLNP